jgi:hypothetical protein
MIRLGSTACFLGGAALCGCAAALPAGPTVTAFPEPGKTAAQFQEDDAVCRQYSWQQIGYLSPAEAANQSATPQGGCNTAYIQCMYARGNSVASSPAYAYGYPYPYYGPYGDHLGTPTQPY